MYKLKVPALLLLTILSPIKSILLTVMALTVVDLVTGIAASRKANIPITSAGLKQCVVKIVVYELAVILAYFTGLYLTGPEVPIMKIMAGFIGITELKSCLENLDIVTGGNTFKILIDRLQSLASRNRD